MSNRKGIETLGMPIGTASHRLRKILLFQQLKKHKENICVRCGLEIETVEELSVEHIKPWEGISAELFWDLDNIAFSHMKACVARRRQWLNSFKEGKPCKRCGIVYPPCALDLHHRDRKEKTFNIGQGSFRFGRERLLEEIAKCDLLCSNCHRIIEFQFRGEWVFKSVS